MGFLPPYFTRKISKLPSFKQLCRKPTNPPAPPALAGALPIGAPYLCVSPLNTSSMPQREQRRRPALKAGVQNSFRFVWVLRKMFTDTEHSGMLPTSASLTRAPVGRAVIMPPLFRWDLG